MSILFAGEQGAEDTMMARSHNIIKSKLGRFPKQMLLKVLNNFKIYKFDLKINLFRIEILLTVCSLGLQ